CVFFFNDTATTEIYTLSLHDALPICAVNVRRFTIRDNWAVVRLMALRRRCRSEEPTSELQSHSDLVCRLLLEKKITQKGSIYQSGPLEPSPACFRVCRPSRRGHQSISHSPWRVLSLLVWPAVSLFFKWCPGAPFHPFSSRPPPSM